MKQEHQNRFHYRRDSKTRYGRAEQADKFLLTARPKKERKKKKKRILTCVWDAAARGNSREMIIECLYPGKINKVECTNIK